MKNVIYLFYVLLSGLLLGACSDSGTENELTNGEGAYALFLKKTIEVNANESQIEVVVDWANTSWEITAGQGDIVKSITPMSGGSKDGGRQFTKVAITCNANSTMSQRTQSVQITDLTNGSTTELLLEQDVAFEFVTFDVDLGVRYQSVVGFGGMYNPIIWCGDNLISAAQMNKMYGKDGLGYSILRLMIYPNEADWNADVEAAKIAQDNGAIVFACPWDCTDALSETIKKGDKDIKRLKEENYDAYADHLIRYVEFMKQNGVDIYAISMQNEPDMDFTYWTPQEVVNFMKQCGSKIRQTGVKLMSPEACGMSPDYTDPVLNDAEAFAQTDIVAGHLYQGFIDWSSSYVKDRHDYICGLYSRLQGKTWWMTEHLFNDGESSSNPADWEFQDWGYCLNHLGKELHMCMEGYCSAYVYWYLKRFYGLMGDNDGRSLVDEGEISKNGYIMAHYAQYATGTVRIKAATDNEDVCATAYINETGDELSVILLNLTDDIQCVEIPVVANKVVAVVTDRERNMEAINTEPVESGKGNYVLLPSKSIVSVRLSLM